MLASTIKGLVLHTADDAGNVGPDYLNGWGLMNTDRAAWVITNNAAWNSMPHILDPLQPSMVATNGDNFRDNVEQVIINQPTNGWYVVDITHKGVISNVAQDVSIIITGNTPTNAPDFLVTMIGALGDAENPTETNGWVQITWPGVVGALYQFESCTNLLDSGSWTNHENVINAILEVMNYTDTNAPWSELRFYRMKRLK